jgi:hypothetical protein
MIFNRFANTLKFPEQCNPPVHHPHQAPWAWRYTDRFRQILRFLERESEVLARDRKKAQAVYAQKCALLERLLVLYDSRYGSKGEL